MALDVFLREIVTLLSSAVLVVAVCGRLRIPPIVGLVVTGILIGPHGFGLISGVEEVELFAEVGVALLLFTIGLEISADRLRRLRRTFLVGGSVQLATTSLIVTVVAGLSGLAWPKAIFVGWVVALSSTALVLRLLATRRETDTPHGRIALGILLFQDFMILPMIALTPLLAGSEQFALGAVLARLAGAIGALIAVILVARRLMPRVLEAVERSGVREVLLLGALALCLGMGWLTHAFGFSLALGAFLAGVVLSGSLFAHQIIADIAPFRDVFSGVFFISIGMLLDVQWAVAHPVLVPGVAAAVVVLKIGTAAAAAMALRYPVRTVVLAAFPLAQIGEFSFVLMEVGMVYGVLAGDRFQLVLAAAVLTLLATPAVAALSIPLSGRLASLLPARRDPEADVGEVASKSGHVIVVGFGDGGRLLARVLREAAIPYVVIDLSGEVVRRGREAGEPMLYGDATREEVLLHAGIERANVIVFEASEPSAVMLGVGVARRLAPGVEIIVRARLMREIEGLLASGADQIVAEEFETAIEVFTRVLERFHVPRNIIRAQTRVLRGEGYRMLRASSIDRTVSQAVVDALEAGTTELYRLDSESRIAGRSLSELDLRRRSGATVIAVVRDGQSHPNPGPDLSLATGDCLVLMGSHEEVDRAFAVLGSEGGEATESS